MGDSTERLLHQALGYALDYKGNVRERRVAPDAAAIAALDAFDAPLPVSGMAGEDMLRLLHEVGAPATLGYTSGRYFGFVNGGVHPPALAARMLADAWDQNAALHVMSPVAAKLEAVCERWLVELLGLPSGTAVGLVGGTSVSLLCGLVTARDALLARAGWDVAANGLFGAPPIRVVVGEQAHGAVWRALSLAGLGIENCERVACDAQGRLRADALPALDANTLLVLAAGNVNTGAFDPFREACQVAREAGAWVHVDGAFGLWAAASPDTAALCDGMALADAWSADAHKTLNAPYDCGLIFCRDRAAFASAMRATGAYLEFSEQRDGMAWSPDMSRRARGIDLWATLATLGRDGVAELVARLCGHAHTLARGLSAAGFEILNDVVFNQVLLRAGSPKRTQALLATLQAGGEIWCGGTTWQDAPAIRLSVCAGETTDEDIERTVAAFVAAQA